MHSEFAIVRLASRVLNDVLLIVVAFGITLAVRALMLGAASAPFDELRETRDAGRTLMYLALFILCYLWVAYRYGLYSFQRLNDIRRELRLIGQACATSGLTLCGVLYLLRSVVMPRGTLFLLVALSSLLLSARRSAEPLLSARADRKGSSRTIAIVGSNQFSFVVSEHLRGNPQLSYNFLGFIRFLGSNQGSSVTRESILGDLSDIESLTKRLFIEEILIAEYVPTEQIIDLIDRASLLGLDVRSVSGYYPQLTVNAPVDFLGDFPVTSLHRAKSRLVASVFKRFIDILLSSLALLFTAVPIAIVALIIKLDSEGPAFYVSQRLGKRGRPFRCYKLRTMVQNADALRQGLLEANERDNILFKLRSDPRITRIGRFLRKYSIDELPQLLNVLLGNMSLVGPRPPLPGEVAQYKLDQLHRLSVLPGITGLWQVKARMDSSFARYIALDMAYVENWSPWLDTKILFRTLNVVVRGTGV